MAVNDRSTLFLNFGHLALTEGFHDLMLTLLTDYYRYEQSFRKAV
jgi:hypothetical protein